MLSEGKVRESCRKLEPGSGLMKSSVTVATVTFGPGKVAPPSCEIDIRSTAILSTVSSQTTNTVPSGPTFTAAPWRPPVALLLCEGLRDRGLLQISPPSVEREKRIWSLPTPELFCPVNLVQAA